MVSRARGAVQLLEKAPATPPLSSSLACRKGTIAAQRERGHLGSWARRAGAALASASSRQQGTAPLSLGSRLPAPRSRGSRRWKRRPPRRPAPAAPHQQESPASGLPLCPAPPALQRHRRPKSWACRTGQPGSRWWARSERRNCGGSSTRQAGRQVAAAAAAGS